MIPRLSQSVSEKCFWRFNIRTCNVAGSFLYTHRRPRCAQPCPENAGHEPKRLPPQGRHNPHNRNSDFKLPMMCMVLLGFPWLSWIFVVSVGFQGVRGSHGFHGFPRDFRGRQLPTCQ
eukprot:gene15446-biopygen23188